MAIPPIGVNPNVGAVGAVVNANLTEIIQKYADLSAEHKTIQDNLLKQLNDIFNTPIKYDDRQRHISFIDDFVKNICVDSEEANRAYKFYGRKIVDQFNRLGDYILQTDALLDQLRDLPEDTPTDSGVALPTITELEMIEKSSNEVINNFSLRCIYDYDAMAWTVYQDDYRTGVHEQIQGNYPSYEALRQTPVDKKRHQIVKEPIEIMREVNLLDRLRAIRVYYQIDNGKSDAVYPNDVSRGYPGVKEAADAFRWEIENFYWGYISDRNGSDSTVLKLLETKALAIQASLADLKIQLDTFSYYTEFLNRALDVLHSSTKNQIIPNGVRFALTYLCGGPMYTLLKDNGVTCLVIKTPVANRYSVIKADKEGMNFLLGDDGTTQNYRGNCYAKANWNTDCNKWLMNLTTYEVPDRYFYSNALDADGIYIGSAKYLKTTFVLPKQIQCELVTPESVKAYKDFNNKDKVTDDVIKSCQEALQSKVNFCTQSIEALHTDIDYVYQQMTTFDTANNTFNTWVTGVCERIAQRIS
ncbi:MAG: hypothetical protein MJ218_00385 [Opitutales bacterium]|nr:hypothetical protein [Opitutales bacterium]